MKLPRAPVLTLASLLGPRAAGVPSLLDSPFQQLTTSGRAAISHALPQLELHPGDALLVPRYHCPTMIAPLEAAGVVPVFYGLDDLGRPLMSALEELGAGHRVRGLLVAHYFGLPRSLAAERAWCDARGLALIEDCAHSLYGLAGDRPVGAWGNVAIGSLTKFLPLPEAGLLCSWHSQLKPIQLKPQGWKAEIKGLVRLVETTVSRFVHGFASLAGGDTAYANAPSQSFAEATRVPASERPPPSDLRRINLRPLSLSRWLVKILPHGSSVNARRGAWRRLAASIPIEFRLGPEALHNCVPYALAVRLPKERSDAVYFALRARGVPVNRWDLHWPWPRGEAAPADDWARTVLQVLCHQSLSSADLDRIEMALKEHLG